MSRTAVDITGLEKLLREFQLITNVRISFWDVAGSMCASSGGGVDSPFCSCLRQRPELDRECRACDAMGIAQARDTGKLCVFTCHAGLHEYVYPVEEDGRLIGFFMIGQVYMPDVYGDILGERGQIWEKFGLDPNQLRELLMQLPVMTHEKMLAAAHMLEALAGYVYMKGFVRRREMPLCERLDGYIRDNLCGELTLDALAARMNVSRSKLCHCVRGEMDMSVLELVNHRRVECAARLLRQGVRLEKASAEAGFSSPGYCARVFKKTLGMTPCKFTDKGEMDGYDESNRR